MKKYLKCFFRFIRHPLFLLVVGGVGSVFLVPWISERADKKRLLQETKLKKAVEIVENNTKMLSQLNQLETRLGIFHYDNGRLKPSPRELKQRQDKLAEDANGLYLEFNKTGWWWCRDLQNEAIILEIVPTGSDRLRQHVDAYNKNVYETVEIVSKFWRACVAADYDYRNSNISKLENEAHNCLDDVSNVRGRLLQDLIDDFRQPQ